MGELKVHKDFDGCFGDAIDLLGCESTTYYQFVSMVESGDIEPLMKSKSIYRCLSCFACVDRCPRGVEPAKLVEAVRLEVIRQQGANHLKADDVPAFIDEDVPQQAIVSALRKYTK